MPDSPIRNLTDPTMFANLVSEFVGVIGTVLILERYLAWQQDKQRRTARVLVVSSLGRRLDQLVLEWGWVLSFFATLSNSNNLDELTKELGPLQARLNALVPEHIVAENRHIIERGSGSSEAGPRVQQVVIEKLSHITSRIEDVLETINGAASILSTSMLDSLIELRESLLITLRGMSDLRDLLANPTSEGASVVFTSAINASMPGDRYLLPLETLWRSIPTHQDPAGFPAQYLAHIPSTGRQLRIVEDFLRLLFPEHDLRQIVERTVVAPRHY